jgi:hypothetical protein
MAWCVALLEFTKAESGPGATVTGGLPPSLARNTRARHWADEHSDRSCTRARRRLVVRPIPHPHHHSARTSGASTAILLRVTDRGRVLYGALVEIDTGLALLA